MKDKNVGAILALFLGGIGVHKFYLGRIGTGILYLLFSFTFIPALLGVIDFFILALMDTDEFNRRYNGANMLGPSPVVVNMLSPGQAPPPAYGWPHQQQGYGPVPGYGPQQPGYGPGPHGYPHGAAPTPGYGPSSGVPGHGVGAPTSGRSSGPSSGPRNADELAVQLEKLNELRISGLLTEDEFAAQKAKLLASM